MTGTPPERDVTVLVVDDDPMVRAALVMMLDGVHGIRVVGEAADGSAVPDAVARHAPSVVLMDLRMPGTDGVTATRRLRARPEAPAVLVLTTFDSDDDVTAALLAGANGFLLKDTPPAEIVAAVRRAAGGEPTLSPPIVGRLMASTVSGARARHRAAAALDVLSARETDVAAAVAQGLSNADVAARLHVSLSTVKAHISTILAKLGLENRTQLAMLARDAGLG